MSDNPCEFSHWVPLLWMCLVLGWIGGMLSGVFIVTRSPYWDREAHRRGERK